MSEKRIIDVDFPEKEVNKIQNVDQIPNFYIEVITPMFGGGVKAGEVDLDNLIRPSSIRGHLRFWWRATRGARYETVDELRQQERKIWGDIKNPSIISISVEVTNKGEPFDSNDQRFSYVLFPFRQNRNIGRIGIKFSLTVNGPQEIIRDEVIPTLKAWVNFGGIGTRTRKGCGALYCEELAFNYHEDNWYQEFLKKCSNYNIREWPTMPSKVFLKDSSYTNSLECWENSIKPMKDFRQGIGIGRNRGDKKPFGRSFWPEAESVRELIIFQRNRSRPLKYNGQDYWHDTDQNITPGSFPRSEFGMPIILEIRGEDIKPTIKPGNNIERMASPIILRPFKYKNGSGVLKYKPMILLLQKPQLHEAYIEPGIVFPKEQSDDKSDLTEGVPIEQNEIRIAHNVSLYYKHPIRGRSSNNSALEAFITYAKEKGFQEVS